MTRHKQRGGVHDINMTHYVPCKSVSQLHSHLTCSSLPLLCFLCASVIPQSLPSLSHHSHLDELLCQSIHSGIQDWVSIMTQQPMLISPIVSLQCFSPCDSVTCSLAWSAPADWTLHSSLSPSHALLFSLSVTNRDCSSPLVHSQLCGLRQSQIIYT